MCNLLKEIYGWILLGFFLFCTIISSTEANATVYLFSQQPLSHKLTFIGIELHEPGTFDVNNKICAQQTRFVSRNPWQDYKVMELDTLEAQKQTIMSNIPEDGKFIVVNSTSQTWHTFHRMFLTPILGASDYETQKPQLSSLCYTEELIFLPKIADIMAHIVIGFAFLAISIILISILTNALTYCYDSMENEDDKCRFMSIYYLSLMGLFVLLCAGSLVGLLSTQYIAAALISIVANEGIWIFTAISLIHFRQVIQNNWNFGAALQGHLWVIIMAVKIIWLFLLVALRFQHLIGWDNASPFTGQFYLNMRIENSDDVEFRIPFL
jgi:hypothetical protein